jgi:hypothetical protein
MNKTRIYGVKDERVIIVMNNATITKNNEKNIEGIYRETFKII